MSGVVDATFRGVPALRSSFARYFTKMNTGRFVGALGTGGTVLEDTPGGADVAG